MLSEQKEVKKEIKEDVILDILKDHIVWYRLREGMNTILNAYHPGGDVIPFEPDLNYTGYGSALKLMGVDTMPRIKQVDIHKELHKILSEIMESDQKADVLAQRLYAKWLEWIKEYYTELDMNHKLAI